MWSGRAAAEGHSHAIGTNSPAWTPARHFWLNRRLRMEGIRQPPLGQPGRATRAGLARVMSAVVHLPGAISADRTGAGSRLTDHGCAHRQRMGLGTGSRARGDEPQAIKWLAYAGAVAAATLAVPAALVVAGLIDPTAASLVGGTLQAITLPCLAAAIGVGILRYRLWQIDILINRTPVYGALTACVVGLYVLVVGYFAAIFQARNELVSLLAAGVVAVVFQPLRERLQRGVDRLLYGLRDEPYAVLAGLSRRLEATLAADTVLSTIVETIRDALKVPYAAIRLCNDSNSALAASSGSPIDPQLLLPLVYQHEPVGELIIASRAPGEAFNPADRRLLEDLARQVGVAAHAVQLTADLQRSCERLVTTREEERRRLRRDLHDGLGPVLAGLTLQLDAARGLLHHDPVAADVLLGQLKARTQAAVSDIRRLVYALRPPALDDLGLCPALRAAAAQYDGNPSCTRITLEIQDNLPTLPAAVEVATYRIAQEALANAIRHADATECVLRLSLNCAAGMLHLEVIDNGCGLPPSLMSGVGLHSWRVNGSATSQAAWWRPKLRYSSTNSGAGDRSAPPSARAPSTARCSSKLASAASACSTTSATAPAVQASPTCATHSFPIKHLDAFVRN